MNRKEIYETMILMLDSDCSPKEVYESDLLSAEEFDSFIDNTNTFSLRFYKYFHLLENSSKNTATDSFKVDLLEDIKKELEKT